MNLPINEVPNGWPDELPEETGSRPNAIDAFLLERRQQAELLERGVSFTTPILSVLGRFAKRKERTWLLKQHYLGTMDLLAEQYIDLDFEEANLASNVLPEARRLVRHNRNRMARIVAIAVLNSQWRIWLGSRLLARYFRWHLTPAKLYDLTTIIQEMSNYTDFINSIRLMYVATRTTTPALMENPEEKRRG